MSRWTESLMDRGDTPYTDSSIEVMGRSYQRKELRRLAGGSARVIDRADKPKRHFITRSKSPVGNVYERDKDLSRADQIEAFAHMFWTDWVSANQMPDAVAKWLEARADEINAGHYLDLVCDCRPYRSGDGIISKNAPADCHGNVLANFIYWRAAYKLTLDWPIPRRSKILFSWPPSAPWDIEFSKPPKSEAENHQAMMGKNWWKICRAIQKSFDGELSPDREASVDQMLKMLSAD